MKKLHHIVIVGGGAGGLGLATNVGNSLGKKGQARITLVDASLTHFWKPLLHEVAAGSINSYEDELNYFAHASKNNFEFQLGKLEALDRNKKTIRLSELNDDEGKLIAPARELDYDSLVIAIGSTTNDFGTEGAQSNCIFLDSRAQAERFHKRFMNTYLRAHATQSDEALNIAIVGAGATGVELAAELHHAAQELARYGLNDIRPENVKISIIEAANRVLPVLSPRVSTTALAHLEKMSIQVFLNEKVTEITETGLNTASGKTIPACLKVWSAGIKAPEFLRDLGLETNKINQLIVRPSLQTSADDTIFALGDCAACPQPNGKWVPPRAQCARQQALFLANQFKRQFKGKPLQSFRFHDYGSLISLSKTGSVGQLLDTVFGDINVQGGIARYMYLSLYRLHQKTLFGSYKLMFILLKDFFNKTTSPKLKLH